MTFGHTAGFRRDPEFAAAVLAANPKPLERAFAWRTHTLCWAARSCLALDGDFVECGTYEGYSMEVVLRYLDGLEDRALYLYDVFDPSGSAGEGKRLPEHSPALYDTVRARLAPWPNALVTRGRVPDVLSHVSPERVAFLHIDMNNQLAEAGAIAHFWPRLATGGMVIFDDYGWTGYQDQKAAADHFATRQGLSVLELPTGQGLLIKR
jgi:predicted O-methyltransferase YrrM